MAAGAIPSSMLSVSNFTDDLTKDAIDEETNDKGALCKRCVKKVEFDTNDFFHISESLRK